MPRAEIKQLLVKYERHKNCKMYKDLEELMSKVDTITPDDLREAFIEEILGPNKKNSNDLAEKIVRDLAGQMNIAGWHDAGDYLRSEWIKNRVIQILKE